MSNATTVAPPNGATPPADPLAKGGQVARRQQSAPQQRQRERPAPPAPYQLATREPTGLLGGCTLLVEGPEFSGKTTEALELGMDERVGDTYLIPLGGTEQVDVWARAGYRYRLVHPQAGRDAPWTRQELMAMARAVNRLAWGIKNEGGKPPLFIIDSATHLWRMLSRWAANRARTSGKARRMLERDPNAEIQVGALNWAAASDWHDEFMAVFANAPAITVFTARGRDVAVFDEGGQPVKDENNKAVRGYKVQAQGNLGYASQAWVRLSRDEHPAIVGLRLPERRDQQAKRAVLPYNVGTHRVVDPSVEPFKSLGITFSLAWLVFDVLGMDPGNMTGTSNPDVQADAEPPPEPAAPAAIMPGPDDPEASEAPGRAPAGSDVVAPNR